LQIVGLIFLGEFDDQKCIRVSAHGRIDHGGEHRDLAPQRDHGAIDQLHRNGAKLDQMLGGIHRLIETAEVADAEHSVADHRPQLEFDLGGEGERAFRADQKMGHVVRRIARNESIEIVAADPALHFRKPVGDLGRLALAECQHVAKQRGGFGRFHSRKVARHLCEMQPRAVGQSSIDRNRVVAHGAVSERPPAAGIVAGHAADGGARGGGDVDRKPQAVPL